MLQLELNWNRATRRNRGNVTTVLAAVCGPNLTTVGAWHVDRGARWATAVRATWSCSTAVHISQSAGVLRQHPQRLPQINPSCTLITDKAQIAAASIS